MKWLSLCIDHSGRQHRQTPVPVLYLSRSPFEDTSVQVESMTRKPRARVIAAMRADREPYRACSHVLYIIALAFENRSFNAFWLTQKYTATSTLPLHLYPSFYHLLRMTTRLI